MAITLLSDFSDCYPASMKGVILGINPSANIVDISHSVPRHDIHAGAFMLMTTAKYFPAGSVHIAVVDPCVGTERRPIAIRAAGFSGTHFFVGPDNGILIPAARSIGEFETFEITNMELLPKNISSTFHGRDIFAPVGAYLSNGSGIEQIGQRIYDPVDMDFGEARIKDGLLIGRIIFIDPFGNIVTNISSIRIRNDLKEGDILEFKEKKLFFQASYGFCKKGKTLALIGSHGFLEIAVNQGSAARYFKGKTGDKITMRKIT